MTHSQEHSNEHEIMERSCYRDDIIFIEQLRGFGHDRYMATK